MDDSYSTRRISEELKKELVESLQNIKGWGSVEIMIQDYKVTQITERSIKKANVDNV